MKLSEVVKDTKVTRKNINGDCTQLVGKIVSEEVQKNSTGGQFKVLVEYEIQPDRFIKRWVAGGNLTKVDW